MKNMDTELCSDPLTSLQNKIKQPKEEIDQEAAVKVKAISSFLFLVMYRTPVSAPVTSLIVCEIISW